MRNELHTRFPSVLICTYKNARFSGISARIWASEVDDETSDPLGDEILVVRGDVRTAKRWAKQCLRAAAADGRFR